ncbi:glycosyltransferase family 4 protein [Microbacterium immunditiarum]|uniref:Glycosyltransferase involved in cell wall biosynthesis n=1 Tax=Microbacterium immunditiarum TaxID=337480 RepID=A0A7Y9GQU7_9MICO|nr:glycosyltransferase family 1 protein [Microbacterium immunditiarum]NYE21015.1 glycosyltransferase involved in cell wall biosynthesis [Microbacterium immunditiarum]
MPRVLVDLLSYTGTKGGMEVYARELYRKLGELAPSWEYIGYMSREGYAQDRSWFPGETVDSGISGENRFEWALGELFAVGRAARRHGADLVHSPATLGPRKTAMPTVVTMHDMLYWSHPEYMSTPLYTEPVKFMERLASRNATRILTISEESREAIVRYLRVPHDRIDLVPLAGTPLPGVDRSRAGEHGPMVLATGNRRPHKNWPSLIRALPLVAEADRPRVVVTGSHGDDPLTAVVEETGMLDWVELKSWVDADEMRDLYSTATVLAMPSFADGFSLPALEAMMAGLPVMISDLPVYREVVGDVALFIDPYDLTSIATAMTTAATDLALLADLAQRGHERASLFSWDRTARETLATFEAALAQGAPRR